MTIKDKIDSSYGVKILPYFQLFQESSVEIIDNLHKYGLLDSKRFSKDFKKVFYSTLLEMTVKRLKELRGACIYVWDGKALETLDTGFQGLESGRIVRLVERLFMELKKQFPKNFHFSKTVDYGELISNSGLTMDLIHSCNSKKVCDFENLTILDKIRKNLKVW